MKFHLDKHKHILLFSIAYLLLFIPFIGHVHLFDWDEINFAEAAREMILTGDWLNVQINFEPFWEKPPLFIWIQAFSMSIFGINEFAARFPNVLIGLVTVLTIYFSVKKRYGHNASIYSVLFYAGSFTPHFYFKTGIIDPLFNLFIFISIINLVSGIENRRLMNFFLAGLSLGFAVITKGPVSILLVGLTGLVYQIVYKNNFYSFKELLFILLGLLILPMGYFGMQVTVHGWWFLNEFLIYQIDLFRYPIASHGQPFYYHFIVLLIGCFPVFVLSFSGLFSKINFSGDRNLVRFMNIMFWVVLIVFSSVTTKIVHYSSMCYIPLSIIGGVWLSKNDRMGTKTRLLFVAISILWMLVYSILSIPAISSSFLNDIVSTIEIRDKNVVSILATDVSWSLLPLITTIIFIVISIVLAVKNSRRFITLYLIINTVIISVFISSVVPSIEKMIQGDWIGQLKTYKDKPYTHFTYGFKSYAHYFYTSQTEIKEVKEIKTSLLKKNGYKSIYDLDQHEKKAFSKQIRDYILYQTNLPVTVSAKKTRFEDVEENFPNLIKVFDGNGYGVWERAK